MTANELATKIALVRIATSSVIRSCDHGLKISDIPHLQKHIRSAYAGSKKHQLRMLRFFPRMPLNWLGS